MNNLQTQMNLLEEAHKLYGGKAQKRTLMECHIRARLYGEPDIFGGQLRVIIQLFLNDVQSGEAVQDDTEN